MYVERCKQRARDSLVCMTWSSSRSGVQTVVRLYGDGVSRFLLFVCHFGASNDDDIQFVLVVRGVFIIIIIVSLFCSNNEECSFVDV